MRDTAWFIILGGIRCHVLPHNRGYRIDVKECPSCMVAGPVEAYCGDGGDLYCVCGGFHLGPVEPSQWLDTLTVHTTAREPFTGHESRAMARLVFKRFGRDIEAATAAWRRLLGSSCSTADFERLTGIHEEIT
jgi:hypothetical protein